MVFIFFRRRAGFGLSGGGLFPRCTKLLVAITSGSLAYVIESCLLVLALELCLLLFVIELCLHVPVRNVSPPCCDSVTTAAFEITNDDVCASVRVERDDVCAPVRVKRVPSSGSNSPASWQIVVSGGEHSAIFRAAAAAATAAARLSPLSSADAAALFTSDTVA